MKKTIVILLLALTLAFSFAGCGGGSTDTSDEDLINTLLDNFQTAMTSMDADKLVSFYIFPYSDNETTYSDAATLKTALTTFFATLSSYNSFQVTNRVITISGDSAIVNCTRYYKYRLKDGTTREDTGSWVFTGKKISGTWKCSSTAEVSSSVTKSTISGVTTSLKGFFREMSEE